MLCVACSKPEKSKSKPSDRPAESVVGLLSPHRNIGKIIKMQSANTLATGCQLPSHTHPPYPPGFAFANPSAGASGFANANHPTPAPPIVAGLRWDRWNQRSDGTQLGTPGGSIRGRRRWDQIVAGPPPAPLYYSGKIPPGGSIEDTGKGRSGNV